jgi:hypothetical protein
MAISSARLAFEQSKLEAEATAPAGGAGSDTGAPRAWNALISSISRCSMQRASDWQAWRARQ